jgi:hypothetical protein
VRYERVIQNDIRRLDGTHSASYQLGVIIVARGNICRYTGTTSAATYNFPASPMTAGQCINTSKMQPSEQ